MKVTLRRMAFATTMVLTLLSVSVTSVFAANPVQGSKPGKSDPQLEAKWNEEITALEKYKFLESRIPKWMDAWLRTPRLHHARTLKNMYANEAHFAVQQAEIIAEKHAGFDEKGRVIDTIQATQSVQTLGIYLDELRVIINNKLYRLHPRVHKRH